MKRIWILLAITLVSVGLFTACTSSADTLIEPSASPSVSPTASPAPSPVVTNSPVPSASPEATNGGVTTVEDAQRVSDQVSEEVEKLSELKTAEALVVGNIAMVGVRYDAQYQEGLTDRLKEMVVERAQAVDKSLSVVHVRDDAETYEKLLELRERLGNQQITFEQLQTQLLDLTSSENASASAR